MPHHPFRFGVNVYGAKSREEWIAKAQKIEALRYDTFFVADHSHTFPPIAGMMAAAAATTTVHIGSNVLANDFRYPVILGRELAAVDVFSNGRLIFGLGTGFYRPDYDKSGIPFAAPGVRVSRLEEAVHIIKGIFTTDPFSFAGKYYTVQNVSIEPMPLQQPHPPLLLGGGSPRILAIAAREADIVSFNIRTTPEGGFDTNSISPEATAEKVAWVKQAAGDRFDDLEFSLLAMYIAITNDRVGAAEQMVDGWNKAGVSVNADQILASPHTLMGTVDEIVADVQNLRERYGFSFVVVNENTIDDFAPVVERLAGT